MGASGLIENLRILALLPVLKLTEQSITHFTKDGKTDFFQKEAFDWVQDIESKWTHIRDELEPLLEDRAKIPNLQEINPTSSNLSSDDKWKSFVIYVYGSPVDKNCARCPKTAELLKNIPGMETAMFSILAPGKNIPEHRGIYNGFIRWHLPLRVPKDREKCYIIVNGKNHVWKEGEMVIFDDTFKHQVSNDTEDERVVLLVDIQRPLTGWLDRLNRMVIRRLEKTSFVQDGIKFLKNRKY